MGLYSSLSKGFIEAASESHHQVLTCNCNTLTDTRIQGDVILQLLDKKNIGGVAIVPTITPMPGHQLDVLHSHGIPVVFCHRRPPGLMAPLITWPFVDVGRRGGEVIIACGHRRVAFVSAGRYEPTIGSFEGLQGVLAQNGLQLPEHHVLYNMQVKNAPAEDDVHHLLEEMLQSPDRPTAVFCTDTTEAERVFLEATRLGLCVPEDLSIVGFGCIWREGVLSQRLAAVTVDERGLGRQVALLLGKMQAGQQPFDSDETILMPLGFSEGRTLSPASGVAVSTN